MKDVWSWVSESERQASRKSDDPGRFQAVDFSVLLTVRGFMALWIITNESEKNHGALFSASIKRLDEGCHKFGNLLCLAGEHDIAAAVAFLDSGRQKKIHRRQIEGSDRLYKKQRESNNR